MNFIRITFGLYTVYRPKQSRSNYYCSIPCKDSVHNFNHNLIYELLIMILKQYNDVSSFILQGTQ